MHIEPKGVIRLLNTWLEKDPKGITILFSNTTMINSNLADEHRMHTVVTQGDTDHFCTEECVEGCKQGTYDIHNIDPMDIINGLFGGKRINVVRDELKTIIRFEQA